MSAIGTILIGLFGSAQFQSFLRSSLKMAGVWLVARTAGDPSQVDTIVGAVMSLYGLMLSSIAHSAAGSPVSGTAAGSTPAPNIATPAAVSSDDDEEATVMLVSQRGYRTGELMHLLRSVNRFEEQPQIGVERPMMRSIYPIQFPFGDPQS